jgi:drug/metabolite transporter (DMT)-like permease
MVWAFAVILFRKSGESVHPIALNLFKNLLGAVLILPTLWLFGGVLFRQVPTSDYLVLIVSGVLGIGIADTLFFMCLNRLGAGLTAIVDCLYSPFVISLSFFWLGEHMNALQLLGAGMIVGAVLLATVNRPRGKLSRRDLALGILWGALAMGGMAVGIVIIKPLLGRSPILWVSEVRLLAGIAVLGLVLLVHPARRAIMASTFSSGSWGYTVSGSFVGSYVAMILWLVCMKNMQVSIASALNQTSNIFVFIFAALLLREPINLQRVAAIALAVAGAMLVTLC